MRTVHCDEELKVGQKLIPSSTSAYPHGFWFNRDSIKLSLCDTFGVHNFEAKASTIFTDKTPWFVVAVLNAAQKIYQIKQEGAVTPPASTGENMNGSVYIGAVVKTTMVVQAEGASSVVPVSEVVFESSAFAAANDEVARARVAADAIKHDPTLDFANPLVTIEVKLFKAA